MNIFKTYSFAWWQMGILKLSTISFGIIVGAYWHEFFSANLLLVALIALISGIYIATIAFKK